MKNTTKLLAAAAGLSLASSAFAVDYDANLSVTIDPGTLVMTMPGTVTPDQTNITPLATAQTIDFQIDGIQIDDFLVDGQAWQVTVSLGNLSAAGQTDIAAATSFGGFNTAAGATNTISGTNNSILTCTAGDSVTGFTTNFDASYVVNAFQGDDTYTGAVTFSIVAN